MGVLAVTHSVRGGGGGRAHEALPRDNLSTLADKNSYESEIKNRLKLE